MSFIADRVRETTTTVGTGTVNLAGAPTGFVTFVSGIGSGNRCAYAIVHQTLNQWEVGVGLVTSGSPNTLQRLTVYDGTSGTSNVNFSAGTKDVFVSLAADVFNYNPQLQLDSNGDLQPTDFRAGITSTYDELTVGDTIVADGFVEPDINNDCQPSD